MTEVGKTDFSQRSLYTGLFIIPAILLFCGLGTPAYAELGTGWIGTSFTRKIHLDDEEGLQTFTWSPYQSVGIGTPCADYSYDSATDTETFRIFDERSNRSEIRIQNEYDSGIRQFEGYVTFYAPLNDESLFQIFGHSSPDRATLTMMRGYSSSGGSIRPTSVGGTTIASNCYGVERRINIIHDQNNYVQYYVDGVLKAQFSENDIAVNYWKYGCYGTVYSGTVPAVVKWRAVRTFKDGVPPEMPVITTQPVSQVRGPANGKPDAVFTVAAANATAYQWYKNGAIFTGGSGAATATLTITAVQQSDEGQYCCKVSNTPGVFTNSKTVRLEYARLTNEWKFDNNAEDSVGGQNAAITDPSAVYVAGKEGAAAIHIDGNDGPINVPLAALPKAGSEFTISIWTRLDTGFVNNSVILADCNASAYRIINMHVPWGTALYFDASNSDAAGEYDRVSVSMGSLVLAETWNHFVYTKDAEAGSMTIYCNGVQLASETSGNNRYVYGADLFRFGVAYRGAIDDVRIYNYALSPAAVAYLYFDVSGESVCMYPDDPILQTYDFNDDCKVDLGDLIMMASNWLYTQNVPGLPR